MSEWAGTRYRPYRRPVVPTVPAKVPTPTKGSVPVQYRYRSVLYRYSINTDPVHNPRSGAFLSGNQQQRCTYIYMMYTLERFISTRSPILIYSRNSYYLFFTGVFFAKKKKRKKKEKKKATSRNSPHTTLLVDGAMEQKRGARMIPVSSRRRVVVVVPGRPCVSVALISLISR